MPSTPLLLTLALAAAHQHGNFQDARGDLEARLHRVKTKIDSSYHFASNGAGSWIKKHSEGLEIDAESFSGDYSYRADGSTNIDNVVAERNASVHYRSDDARLFQIKNSLPPTAEPGVATDLTTQSLHLNQTATQDKLTLSHSFVLTDRRPGKNQNGQTELASKVVGTAAVIYFLTPSGSPVKLQTADISGPVAYSQTQTSIDPKTEMPVTTTYNLSGDHLVADMTKPDGKLVLTGHVKGFISGPKGGSFTGSQLTVSTDQEGNITEYELVDADATTIPIPVPTAPKSKPQAHQPANLQTYKLTAAVS